jgi:phosphatidate cytidylyltransferase
MPNNASLPEEYICLPLSLLVFIDRHPAGNVWIFFLLAVIFASDTGAFYFGRFFGRHKLYPSVSPGKTWEGAVGGLISSLFIALIFFRIFAAFGAGILILAGILSIAGQIGDLVESMLKRSCGVKDSGKLLPGHGGFLDRLDGMIFALPVLYIYLTFAVK